MKKNVYRVLATLSLAALASVALAEAPAQAGSCSACHGAGGAAFNPQWPNLAGQHAGYLIRQITAFRDGERSNPAMAPFVGNLSDADIKVLAGYFSSQPAPTSASGEAELVETGRNLAGRCAACHGMWGAPVADEWPVLAGQHAPYLVQQLQAYRRGDRVHSLMQAALMPYDDADFKALAAYYSQMKP
ncbi:MAG: c-type cytochrome [Parahaliea sp.]